MSAFVAVFALGASQSPSVGFSPKTEAADQQLNSLVAHAKLVAYEVVIRRTCNIQ